MTNTCCGNSGGCGSSGSENSCGCGVNRKNKMCMLTQSKHKPDIEKVAALTRNPDHICGCCGRAANKAENLCIPQALKNDA